MTTSTIDRRKLEGQIDGRDVYEAPLVNRQRFELEELKDELEIIERERAKLSRQIDGTDDQKEWEKVRELRLEQEPDSDEYQRLTVLLEGEQNPDRARELRAARRDLSQKSAELVDRMLAIVLVDEAGEPFGQQAIDETPVAVRTKLLNEINSSPESEADPTEDTAPGTGGSS